MTTAILSNYERQEQLRVLIEQQHRLSIAQICSHFSISEATARRDLDALVERGVIRRVHGGAIAVHRAPPEPPVAQRSTEQSELKARIGQLAATLISNRETIFLGSGTTVLEVARHLHSYANLTIITNSLPVMTALSDKPGINLIGLGGVFRPGELSFIGHITIQAMAELRPDKVIIGIRALDPDEGLTNDYVPETPTVRAILDAGKEVIIVADHTKCGRVSVAFVAPLNVVDTLVTDAEIAPELREDFAQKGLRILAA
ncbi:MAG: DeoR/GlpR family DNA-binding transcription regulator [Caldilineaceae bacterium]